MPWRILNARIAKMPILRSVSSLTETCGAVEPMTGIEPAYSDTSTGPTRDRTVQPRTVTVL